MKPILATLAAALMIGAGTASYAKLPPPTSEETAAAAAKAEKDAATKARAAKELGRAQDNAVANYKKNKRSSAGGSTAQPAPEHSAVTQLQGASGADQANDHSATGREPMPSGR